MLIAECFGYINDSHVAVKFLIAISAHDSVLHFQLYCGMLEFIQVYYTISRRKSSPRETGGETKNPQSKHMSVAGNNSSLVTRVGGYLRTGTRLPQWEGF